MRVEAHLAKFARIDATLARLDPAADTELWIWGAMNAATHLLNAVLHRLGATDATDSFHTQFDGLYAVPDRTSGDLRDAVHPPGDVMHVGQPPIAAVLPDGVLRACECLRVIEDLREAHVRGAQALPEGAIARWTAAYGECVERLRAALDAGR